MGLLDRWKSLTPEQKELVFLGIHGTIAGLISQAFRRSGVRVLEAVRTYPQLVVGGVLGGVMYYQIVKRFILGE